ncbi:MAG TPA: TonB-dependent receptor plug domain-containing protein, partial [Novosphingobium sp.]|nr:TonB-dependent receptor plug domain-containing protein [Novosphingobium sp.]
MKKLAFLALSTVLSAPAIAQDTSIVVVASGAVQPVEVVGQSVSVAGQEEIDAVQGADLTRLLERLPGLSFTRNGGLGAQTGIFVRGANADQLLVMIDGVRVADYASPGGGYDLGNLLAGNLAKVELLRGSNSVVWGSQAVGGGLALTTREVNGA